MKRRIHIIVVAKKDGTEYQQSQGMAEAEFLAHKEGVIELVELLFKALEKSMEEG